MAYLLFPAPWHFNSHAPCGAWPISALLTSAWQYFNSHAPCGAWLSHGRERDAILRFQLTRSVWSVTIFLYLVGQYKQYFNSHAPCGAWLRTTAHRENIPEISTHTLRVERDTPDKIAFLTFSISTHTLRVERDSFHLLAKAIRSISTHTLRFVSSDYWQLLIQFF